MGPLGRHARREILFGLIHKILGHAGREEDEGRVANLGDPLRGIGSEHSKLCADTHQEGRVDASSSRVCINPASSGNCSSYPIRKIMSPCILKILKGNDVIKKVMVALSEMNCPST